MLSPGEAMLTDQKLPSAGLGLQTKSKYSSANWSRQSKLALTETNTIWIPVNVSWIRRRNIRISDWYSRFDLCGVTESVLDYLWWLCPNDLEWNDACIDADELSGPVSPPSSQSRLRWLSSPGLFLADNLKFGPILSCQHFFSLCVSVWATLLSTSRVTQQPTDIN